MKLSLVVILSALLPMAAVAQTNVYEAPEAPFEFAPLTMHVFPQKDFPITRYGAKKDDARANMAAFEKAMAACEKAGGGRVVVPAGEWLCGAIHFRSNCELHLDEGAKILFDDNPDLYLPAVQSSWGSIECMNWSPLIYAFECENVAITGPGTVEAKMDTWRKWFERTPEHLKGSSQLYAMMSTGVPVKYRHMEEGLTHMRPQFLQFNRCTNVRLEGFKIRESPLWTIHLLLCKDVLVREIDSFATGMNSDGVDIESSSHVLVEDSRFSQNDDGIVLKSGHNQDGWRLATPTSGVVVRRCDFIRAHGLLVVGSEVSGGINNIYVHDCQTSDESKNFFYIKTNIRRGAVIDNIVMENCKCKKTRNVFNIATDILYQWKTIGPTFVEAPTVIRNVAMRNVEVEETDAILVITGDERKPVRNVEISNVRVGKVNKYKTHFVNVYDLNLQDIRVGQ